MEIVLSPSKRLFLLFFFFAGLMLGLRVDATAAPQTDAQSLPIVMILSEGDPGAYRKAKATDDAMYSTFVSAIESRTTIIISPPILHWLAKRSKEGRCTTFDWAKRLEEQYAVLLTKEEGFVLLVPKDKAFDLDALGFDSSYLLEPLTTAATIKKRFSDKTFEQQTIRPLHLAKLLKHHSATAPVPPKYWYIAGHGLDSIDEESFAWKNACVAELSLPALVNMLLALNEVNSRSVYLLSCYSAGCNALKLQSILAGTIKDERCPVIKQLKYPLLLQCSMDTVSSRLAGRFFDFQEFFAAMKQWDCEGNSDIEVLSRKLSPLLMKATRDERFSNYPSIRMPGASTFLALPLTSTQIIYEPVRDAQTVESSSPIETIQIHTADLQQLTLHIPDADLPTFISRVPGPSHHFIEAITTEAVGPLVTVLSSLFWQGIINEKNFFFGLADKAWFVNRVAIGNQEEIQGLVVFKGSLKHAKQDVTAVYRAANKSFYRLTSRLPLSQQTTKIEAIDEATYVHTVQQIYWHTLPSQDALDEATNKSEHRADHEKLLISFGKKLSVDLSAPLDKEMIQEDLHELECHPLCKEAYINYAAYVHNEATINALVDLGIEGKILAPRDITTLLCHLIDHEYHSLIVEPIKRLTQTEGAPYLFVVVNTFQYLLDVGLHQQALAMYNDLFICLKKALDIKHLADQKKLILSFEQQLMRFVVILIKNNCGQIAAEKVLELLNSQDLGLQVIGLIMFNAMQDAGYSNERLESKKSVLVEIARRLESASKARNIIALYFYEQAMVRNIIACLE